MTDDASDFLQHYGILGMKWGIRRAEGPNGRVVSTRSAPKLEVDVSTDRQGRLRTSGGEGIPAHEDAVAARVAKQKAQKSGTDSLGNKELQSLIKRMNLEQDYARLNPKHISAGKKFQKETSKVIGNTVRGIAQQESNNLGKEAAKIGRRLAYEAAKSAASNAGKRKSKNGGTYHVVRKAIGV